MYFLRISMIVIAGLSITACNKNPEVTPSNVAEISFYNASYTLQEQLSGSINYKSYILYDKSDPNFMSSTDINGQIMPYFGGEAFRQQFPDTRYNSGLRQPWTIYMHTTPGEHAVTFLDTARKVLLPLKVNTSEQNPVTLFISDSAGIYRTLLTANDQKTLKDSTRIRLIHLSPDAGKVFMTADDQEIRPLANPLSYMQATAYMPFKNTQKDTVRIKIYEVSDPSTPIKKVSVETLPGRSYTLVLSGYGKLDTYTDPKGNNITVKKQLNLLINNSY